MDGDTSVLYLSPVIPALTGNGLAMRAGAVLRALSALARVHLLVVPHYPSPASAVPDELAALCAAVAVVSASPGDAGVAGWIQRVAGAFPETRFDVVHHFRLITLPFGAPYRFRGSGPRPRAHLDLDDVESLARLRLAAVYRLDDRELEAQREEREAEWARTLEDAALSDFDRVYVCSSLDRERLLSRARAEVRVLPNAVDLPPLAEESAGRWYKPRWFRARPRPFSLLFVGTLGYFPNEDAVLHFCRQTLPLLRARAPRPVQLDVVGTGPTLSLLAGIRDPSVRVVGAVPDLAPWYRRADAVVVPLRSGGGTRIKVLEALAHQRAVVSTSLGAEGIEAVNGEHLLLADTPADFAAACLRLIADPALARRLAANGREFVRRRYTIEAMTRALSSRTTLD